MPKSDPSTSFKFRKPYALQAKQLISRYPKGRQQSAVIGLLDLCQRQNDQGHYITENAIDTVAEMLSMPKIRVVEVISFYSMLNHKPVGKYYLQLCGTTPCMLCGAKELRQTIENHLHISNGETTEDGLFTLQEIECLGACVNAPVIQINDDYYEDLDGKKIIEILDDLKQGNIPSAGSQIGRMSSEPLAAKKEKQPQ